MVDFRFGRFFDLKFCYFSLIVLVAKLAINFFHFQKMDNFGADVVEINKGSSSASIHLFGATMLSWKPSGKEVFFVSQNSVFDGKKAIRGGVPIVFPFFGPWSSGPQHGFARITKWSVKDGSKQNTDVVTLVLEDSEETRSMWNHKFRIEYTIVLVNDTQLQTDVVITNTGDEKFSFTFLLHSYFSVMDIKNCRILGLQGSKYIDKAKNGEEFVEDKVEVEISEFTDRIYKNTSIGHRIKKIAGDRSCRIEKFNLPDTVIWNPYEERAKSMSDFGDDEWKNMICVESGSVSSPITLESTKTFIASQILTIE